MIPLGEEHPVSRLYNGYEYRSVVRLESPDFFINLRFWNNPYEDP